MHCSEVRNRLGTFLDGETDSVERRRIERHLEDCGRCREELRELESIGTILAEGRVSAVPSGFHSKIRVAAECALENRDREGWGSSLDLAKWWRTARPTMRVAAAAALALGIGLGFLLGSGTPGRSAAGPVNPSIAGTDPYGADVLSDRPAGSLSQVYLAMASDLRRGGE
jgi:anti-sigma factor RsiW